MYHMHQLILIFELNFKMRYMILKKKLFQTDVFKINFKMMCKILFYFYFPPFVTEKWKMFKIL